MPSDADEHDFSAPPQVHGFGGLLFDMDGTIMDSTKAIVQHWHDLGKKLGVDPNEILETSHGRRSIDVLQEYDPSLANWEYVSHMEGQIPRLYGADATELPGSRALLAALSAAAVPWAIVTSGTRPLVTGWLDRLGLAHPANLVVAEDVAAGKPDPEGYRLGWTKLGVSADGGRRQGLVLEDAPAGVRAGKAAGFRVVALATTHAVARLRAAGPDWIVRDLRSVRMAGWDRARGVVEAEIVDALRA